jgi:hypothetical protein
MPSTRSQAKKQQNVEPIANSQSPPITIETQEQSNQEQSNQEQSNQEQSNQEQSNQEQSNQEQSNQEQSNQEQSNQEQSNICGICRDEFDEATKETCDSTPIIVHEHDGGLWSHSFHAKCIAKWIHEKMEEDRVPKCPLCFSTPIPDNIIASMSMVNIDDDDDEIIQNNMTYVQDQDQDSNYEYRDPETYQSAEQNAIGRYYRLHADLDITAPIYFVADIFMNGLSILKLTNNDLNIQRNITITEIKRLIELRNHEIYFRTGGILSLTNARHNLSLSNWTQNKYPSIQVNDVHYTIPPHNSRIMFPELLDHDQTYLYAMYVDYQTYLGEILEDRDLHEDVISYVEKIYKKQPVYWNYPQSVHETGHYSCGYINTQNPFIPEDKRPHPTCNSSTTEHSILWVAFHVDYVDADT